MAKVVRKALDHEANPIALTPEFRAALEASKFPVIVLFMGYSRAGKSTRLNQIITRGDSLNLPGPFVARRGSKAVTVGFDVCGPLSFAELNELHGLGLALDPNRTPDLFLIDCEGMDHLEGCSQGFGKSMFALCQLSVINVIVIGTAMNQNDVVPLTTLFRMSKVVQSAEQQIETGFVVLEREVDVVGPNGEDLTDGSPEFEQSRHRQDAERKSVVYRLLRAADVRCAEQNFIVLEQPVFDHRTSYWNSLHDLMRFWYAISMKTLVLPGSTLISLFEKTVQIIARVPNCNHVNIRFDTILTELVRDEFTTAKESVVSQFDTLIVQPICNLAVDDLKRFKKAQFIATTQANAVKAFIQKANELHPFVCESFRVICAGLSEGIKAEVASITTSTHLSHCIAVLLLDKVRRLLAKTDAVIQREAATLRDNLELVQSYPFSRWGSTLGDSVESKLRKCMDKYELQVIQLPQYTKSLRTLRGQVMDRVHTIEITMRRSWNKQKEAKAEAERQGLRAEHQRTIEKFERDMEAKDAKFAQEAQRLRDEAIRQNEKTEAMFRSQIAEQNTLNAQREQQYRADLRQIEEGRRRAEQEAASLRNRRGGGGGCLLL
jgi:hypothetical protein